MTYLNVIDHPVYYNDFDEGAVEWLRELMKHGHIPPGEIDSRSILEVKPSDLVAFTQCHFFAGIAGWPLALRLAGVPVDVSLWTGSAPCQPFSVAGRQESQDDERHLAPHFVNLVGASRPGVLFGEQVASAEVFGKAPKRSRGNSSPPPDWAWIDDLSDRLEAARYTVGASDFPLAGVGAPHIRQRTYFGAVEPEWLEHCKSNGWLERWTQSGERGIGIGRRTGGLGDAAVSGPLPGPLGGLHRSQEGAGPRDAEPERSRSVGGLGDGLGTGLEGLGWDDGRSCEPRWIGEDSSRSITETIATGRLGNTDGGNSCSEREQPSRQQRQQSEDCRTDDRNQRTGPVNGFWRNADWLFCRDEQWRPVEPGTFPLADGVPGRVGLLRGYGNGINPRQAALYIKAFFEALAIITHGKRESLPDLGIDGLIV